MAKKKVYTFAYVKTVCGKITITADDDDTASSDAYETLEKLRVIEEHNATDTPQEIEVGLLDLKDAEPANAPDRTEE